MTSFRNEIAQKLAQCTPPDGIIYYYETTAYKSELKQMHGNHAEGSLNNFFYAFSVGKKEFFEEFLHRPIQWCQTSIALKKEVGWRTLSDIHEAYAGATWLYTGEDDVSIWKESLEYTNLWFFADKNPSDYSKVSYLDNQLFYTYLQRCLFSKEYQQGIKVFEHLKGTKRINLTSKTGLATLMYAILRHYEYGEFDKARLNKICRKVLGKELKYVYSMGRLDDAVYWLKTMCALRDKAYTPEEVVLTFYEFLEDNEIPDEIKILLKEKGLFTRTNLINQKLI